MKRSVFKLASLYLTIIKNKVVFVRNFCIFLSLLVLLLEYLATNFLGGELEVGVGDGRERRGYILLYWW